MKDANHAIASIALCARHQTIIARYVVLFILRVPELMRLSTTAVIY